MGKGGKGGETGEIPVLATTQGQCGGTIFTSFTVFSGTGDGEWASQELLTKSPQLQVSKVGFWVGGWSPGKGHTRAGYTFFSAGAPSPKSPLFTLRPSCLRRAAVCVIWKKSVYTGK